MKNVLFLFLLISCFRNAVAQEAILVDQINLENLAEGTRTHLWLKLGEDAFTRPIVAPVIIIKGIVEGPVLGITAALHGNELNGIGVINRVLDGINPNQLRGVIIAVPGLNAVSLMLDSRRFIDEEDLNRNFPGKEDGNRSQQYVWQINEKLLPHLSYLIDMHTASFGRENSLYVRADMDDPDISQIALVQDADIILNNKGVPSTADRIAATRTMRAEAILKGIPSLTIEYGNPQVFQEEMIVRGVKGVNNTLKLLGMLDGEPEAVEPALLCTRSYWTYLDRGGILEVHVDNAEVLREGQLVATLKNPFGEIIQQYYAPEDGVVIGKSSNPVNMTGGRIIHLGVLKK